MCAGSGLLIFDDACGFCRGSVRLIRWLDWYNTVEPLPLSAAGECMKRHSISHDDMMTSMHLVTYDGRVFGGAEAIREFGLRMPLLFPIALVLRLRFTLRLAKQGYQFLSANRYRIGRRPSCDSGECAPRRKQ